MIVGLAPEIYNELFNGMVNCQYSVEMYELKMYYTIVHTSCEAT